MTVKQQQLAVVRRLRVRMVLVERLLASQGRWQQAETLASKWVRVMAKRLPAVPVWWF